MAFTPQTNSTHAHTGCMLQNIRGLRRFEVAFEPLAASSAGLLVLLVWG